MKNTNAVRKAGVCGAGKDEVAKSQLTDPPQSLKRSGLNKVPNHLLEVGRVKNDEIVNGVTDTLGTTFEGRHQRVLGRDMDERLGLCALKALGGI